MVDPDRQTSPHSWDLPAHYLSFAQRGSKYAFSILGNANDCEDVVQEAFCRLMVTKPKGIRTEDPGKSHAFAPLFFTTVRNLCIDILRRRERRNDVSLEHVAEPAEPRPNEDGSQLAAAVQTIIASLPTQWADALKLRVDGQLSYQEISAVMDCTHAQVRTWIYRARRDIEIALQQIGYVGPTADSNDNIRLV